jgi:anti-sigma B factor antagonist
MWPAPEGGDPVFVIRHELRGPVCIVRPHGDVRVGPSDAQFRDAIRDLLAQGNKLLVLDFSHVEFIDSTGLGDLAGLRAAAVKAGGNVKLAGLSRRLHDLLALTRMDLVFEVFPDADQAVASYGSAGSSI